jgi:hypothetical protein
MPSNTDGRYIVTSGDLTNSVPTQTQPPQISDRLREAAADAEASRAGNISQTPAPVSTFGGPTNGQLPSPVPAFPVLQGSDFQKFAELSNLFKLFQQAKLEADLDRKIKTEVFQLAQKLVSGPPVSPMGPCSPSPGAIAAMAELGPRIGLTAIPIPNPAAQAQTPSVELSKEMTQKIWIKMEPVILELLKQLFKETSIAAVVNTAVDQYTSLPETAKIRIR